MGYTIAEHSGLGATALEPFHVPTVSDENKVLAAGGVLLSSYGQADDIAEAMLRYIGSGIAPVGVVGSFSDVLFRGMRLWVPDGWAETVLRLASEFRWEKPIPEVVKLANAIHAAAPAPA